MIGTGAVARVVGWAIVVGLVLAVPATASAHAGLERTDPAAGAVLPESPPSITLEFTETVNVLADSIRLVRADGSEVALPDPDQRAGEATISVDVPPLADGTYVVAWRAISADSHPVNGAYSFSVGVAGTVDPGRLDEIAGADRPRDAAEIVLGVGRAASFAGVAVMTGAPLVMWFCGVRPARRRSSALLWAGLATGVVGTLLMFAGQSAVVSGGWWHWGSVTDSTAGWWWFLRLAFLAMSAAVVANADVILRRAPAAIVAWAVAVAAVVAAGGHGITGHHVALGYLMSVAHLVAMAVWVGGIPLLALADSDSRRHDASVFSPLAMGAVVTLALTGTFNAWRQSGALDDLLASRYGHALLVKLAAVSAIVAVAATSRILTRTTGAEAALGRTIRAEALGFVLVLAATAVLVNSPPPIEVAGPSEAAPASAVTVVESGDRSVRLSVDPADVSGALDLTFADPDGAAPIEVTVDATLETPAIGPVEVPVVQRDAGGRWGTDSLALPLAGTWRIRVVARFDEFDASTFEASVELRGSGS